MAECEIIITDHSIPLFSSYINSEITEDQVLDDCDTVDAITFRASLIDWARYQRDKWGNRLKLSYLRQLKREFQADPEMLYRAVNYSIERDFARLTFDSRDHEIRRLRLENAILRAAQDIRGGVA